MEQHTQRYFLPFYIAFMLAFPVGMYLVESYPLSGPTMCAFRLATHLDCPSCGLTRAFRAMGRLDVQAAFRYNPLGPAVFVGALAYWIFATAVVVTGGRVSVPVWWRKRQLRFMYWALTIFLCVGVGRILYQLHHPPPPPRIPQQMTWPLHKHFWR